MKQPLCVLPLLLLPGFLLLALNVAAVSIGEEVVCYFTSWSVYRPGIGFFDVENIDPFLCSTIIYSFIGISNVTWTVEVLDPYNDLCPEDGGNNCAFQRFVGLKETNPDLITLVSVGGWGLGATAFSEMSSDPAKRQIFISSAVDLITKHGFDGLDVDWEYPAFRGGVPEDKENFVSLMTELRAEFNKSDPPLQLSVAAPAFKTVIEEGYDIPRLAPLFNRWHVMSYDYHGPWENRTHHNDPLCSYYLDYGDDAYLNVMYTTLFYLNAGVPPEKLVMGIPSFGGSWTLDSTANTGMLAPAHAPGPAGPYTGMPGVLSNYEICERLQNDSTCTVVHDPNLNEPYLWCSSDKLWCTFDDEASVYLKARNAKNLGLAGVVVWSLDLDDFYSICQKGPFHLIKSMKKALEEATDGDITDCSTPTTPVSQSRTTIVASRDLAIPFPRETTTYEYSGSPNCTDQPDGTTFPHEDCDKYWVCIEGYAVIEACAPGTLWDPDLHICNWEDEVDTEHCNLWDCIVDNTYYPHPDCDKYVWCWGGTYHIETCIACTFWNQENHACVDPSLADTSQCTIPEYCQ